MIFWSAVGGAFLVLFGVSKWFDRKRRGASLGRTGTDPHAAVDRAHLQSWSSHRGDGSGKI